MKHAKLLRRSTVVALLVLGLLFPFKVSALQLTETYPGEKIVVGGKLTYTITPYNDGKLNESGTLLTDWLPPNAVFVSAVVTNGAFTVTSNIFSFRPAALGPGTETTLQFVVTPVTAHVATNLVRWVGQTNTVRSASAVPVYSALPGPKMVVGRSEHTSTLLNDGRVLIAGGLAAGGLTAAAEIYNPAEGAFTLVGSMKSARMGHTATLLPDGTVLIVCGGTKTAELFDPAANAFSRSVTLQAARTYHTATLLPNGDIIVAGGAGTNTLIERIGYAGGQLSANSAGHMVVPRAQHVAVLMPDGKLLFAGGRDPIELFARTFAERTLHQTPRLA